MRVFHFVNEKFGLEDLRRRRLKIATLHELNDPFEFLGVNLADKELRRAFRVMKDEVALKRGLLCFSRDWRNPVMWGHYAAKHTGLCFGFDIPDESLARVSYSRKRLLVEPKLLHNPRKLSLEDIKRILFTKYTHWRYENEVRAFVTLENKDPVKNLYFVEFSEKLKLAAVIVGAESRVSRKSLLNALGDLASSVETFKARPAFKTFRVVRQRNSELWV